MMGLASISIDFLARLVTLHRTTPGVWAENGVYVPGTTSSTPISAVVQAPKREDLSQLAEGESVEGLVSVWTRVELQTADETTGTIADEISVAPGERYKVTSINARREAGYTKALARRTDDRGRSL